MSLLRLAVVYLWSHAGSQVATGAGMDLRKVEAIGTGKARKELYEMLRRAQDGTHFLLLRFDRPVAALVSHEDYLAFSELARQDALAKAVLQGKGYDPSAMTAQEFLDLLATNVKGEANAAE